jgi:hypothetical protein
MHMQQPNNPLSHRPYAETRMTNVLKFPRESRKQSLGQGVRVVSSTRVPELYELQSLEGDIWRPMQDRDQKLAPPEISTERSDRGREYDLQPDRSATGSAVLNVSQLGLGFSMALFGCHDPADQCKIDTHSAVAV